MFPHERSLVSRMQNKPFALLGVSVDDDAEAVKRMTVSDKLTWRSWWDSEKQISSRYEVQYLPSLYIIDAKGVIRFRPSDYDPKDPKALDKVIDQLVTEAEGTGAKS
jgi:hypothetical protein